ncbi:unnamed protein product, partial [Ixodes pacificus]
NTVTAAAVGEFPPSTATFAVNPETRRSMPLRRRQAIRGNKQKRRIFYC